MDAVKTEEGWLTTPDGLKLYTKKWWEPDVPLKARVVFIHGFSDHCNWYPVLFDTFAKNGIKVYSFDQRGWGRSVHEIKQRGLTGPNSQVMADITQFINSLPADEKVPLFLMGHSMGGGEVLVWTSTAESETVSKIRGLLLESPLIGLGPGTTPSAATVFFGKLAAKLMPRMTRLEKLDPSKLSRDPAICKAWEDDPLNHDTATLEMLVGLMDRTGGLDGGKIVLEEGLEEGGKTRVWIAHGTKDDACDYDASRRWFERVKVEDKEFKTYEGWYHKLHSEPGGDDLVFANDAVKWILDRSGPLGETNGNNQKSKL